MQEQEMDKVENHRKKGKTIHIIKLILRLLLGGMFITTAILKLLSIDQFELYIYSFGIFNYLWCTFFARCIIAFEFLLGFCLIIKFYYKYTWWATMATLIGFTLFLVYVAIFRNDSNCHCFGDFVELNPINSIIKNLITIILLLFIRKEPDYKFRFKNLIVGLYFAATVTVCFILFPMDAIYNQIKSPIKEVNLEVFEKIQTDSTFTADFDDGKYIVPVFIPTCKYCKLSMKKLNSIVESREIDKSRINIFIIGDNQYIEKFKE
ncbi:DoxX family membrane protein, partial [Bacteroidales bacterium OttesenSCG-928-C03]|nr:DoxX family membrane protein [Bacteroidales bacterium OttesenSCG-928-C03]